MRLILTKVTFVLCFFFTATCIIGQSFSNISAQFFNDEIEITYDLVGDDAGQSYRVELRSSIDNFSSGIRTATGDIGANIKPGTNLKIYWNPVIELPEGYQGQLQFKLIGEPMDLDDPTSSPIGFDYPVAGSKLKKGKTVNVEWSGTSGNYSLELHRFDSKLISIAVVGGSDYTWQVPEDLSPGKGYEVVLINSTTNKEISSGSFTIGRKLPLGFLIAPVVVAGGVAAGLSGGGGDNGDTGSPLPTPPDPN